MIRDFLVGLYGETFYNTLSYFFSFYFIWLPLLLGYIFWEVWVRYLRVQFFANTAVTLLEIKIPREVTKSPVAMETVLAHLYQTGGEGTFIARYWEGKTRPWFSLEIVSDGGSLHFYVWTRTAMKNIVEAHLYAQYPEIEIREVEDYARKFMYEPEKNGMWSANFKLGDKDVYPIKTYVDFGLDDDPKEEFENNPLASVLEFMASIKPSEQLWMQIIIRAHKKEKRNGVLMPATDWKEAGKKEIKDILAAIKESGRNQPTEGEKEKISGIERSLSKYPFDTGIRVLYFAESKDAYNNATVTGARALFRPFGSNTLNNLNKHEGTEFDYPWQDYKDVRVNKAKKEALDAYKRRMYFYAPYQETPFILTNEELATIFHLPGTAAATPGLDRIQSKRAQPPVNLPI